MPTTATAPLPVSPSLGERNEREPERGTGPRNNTRHASIEERTAALEVRWEVTIPTLATKTDVSNLENRLLRWGIGAAIGLAAVLTALFTHSATRMDNAIAELKAESQTMNARMDRLDSRMDRLDEKIDARFDALMAEIRALGRAQ